MRITSQIRFNLVGFRRYRGKLDKINEKVFKRWAVRYRSFVQLRFNRFSKGGGNWPSLKSRSGSILRDTGTLFNTMAPVFAAPAGSVNTLLKDGVEVGFSGATRHPSGNATIAEIASYHHEGAGNLPVRKIIVPPDKRTLDAMRADMETVHNDAL